MEVSKYSDPHEALADAYAENASLLKMLEIYRGLTVFQEAEDYRSMQSEIASLRSQLAEANEKLIRMNCNMELAEGSVADYQARVKRLEGALNKALEICGRLADQQAMYDLWYVPLVDECRAALNAEAKDE